MVLACVRCRARKIKCDRKTPACSQCSVTSSPCEYVGRFKQRAIDQDVIHELRKKVAELEATNYELENRLHGISGGESVLSKNALTERGSTNSTPVMARGIGSGQMDEVTSVASYLSLSAAGDTKYLGSSSGVLFAGIVNATLSSAGKRPPIADIPMRSGDVHRLLAHDSPAQFYHNMSAHMDEKDADEEGIKIDYSNEPQADEAQALKLVNIYFGHTQLVYPILCREEFMLVFDRIHNEPGFYKSDIYGAFTYDMVLGIASVALNRNQYADGTRRNKYLRAALQKLSIVMCQDGLKALVAILLLAVYSLMHESSAGVWQLVGIAMRLCLELGLHNSFDHECSSGDLEYFDTEKRRRLFWTTFTLDRIVSVTSGRPLGIQDSDISVPLPSGHSDECLWRHHLMAIEAKEKNYERLANISCECPEMTCFIQVLKIRSLMGKISRLFYTKRYDRPTEQHVKMKQLLKQQLNQWHEDILKMGLPAAKDEPQGYQGGGGSCFSQLSWYEILYYNSKQLLSRPSLVFPVIDEQDHFEVLEASSGVLNVYTYLSQSRRLNYTWLTLHSVFMAGISYLYSIGKLMYFPNAMAKLPSNVALFEETRSCSNLLTSMCERWDLSPEARALFDRLSALVLNEFMEQKLKYELNMRLDIPYEMAEPHNNNLDGGVNIFVEKFSELETLFEGQSDTFHGASYQSAAIQDLFEGLEEYEEFLYTPSLNI